MLILTAIVLLQAADSTAAALSWTLYLLGLNPEKQAKLHQELDDAFGRGVDRELSLSGLKLLPYLECCVKVSFATLFFRCVILHMFCTDLAFFIDSSREDDRNP